MISVENENYDENNNGLYIDISIFRTRSEKYEFIKEFVNSIVRDHHEDNKNNETKYKFYSDGTIIRDNEVIMDVIVSPNSFFTFPCKGWYNEYCNDECTYAILSYDICKNIRLIIDHLMLQT
jgi:hypothetical protein